MQTRAESTPVHRLRDHLCYRCSIQSQSDAGRLHESGYKKE